MPLILASKTEFCFRLSGVTPLRSRISKMLSSKWLFSALFVFGGSTVLQSFAFAQSESASIPSTQVAPMQTLSVPAKSLLLQRLHVATLPAEATLKCSVLRDCYFGLTRGFALGADLYGMGVHTLLGPQVYAPGAWLFYDGKVGYQFIDGVSGTTYANGSVGYRGFSFRKEVGEQQNERKMVSRGFTFEVHFGQVISPQYTQGLSFQYYAGKATIDEPRQLLSVDKGRAYRKMLRDFYDFSKQSPQARVGLPAQFELINWKANRIDLPNHLRGYLEVEPFYIQNELSVAGEFESVEKNFGLRTQAVVSYESTQIKSGRHSFLLGLGFDLSTSNSPTVKFISDQALAARVENEDLPARKVISPVLNLEASYQF